MDVVVILDDFGTDKATLKVGMDHSGTLRSLAATAVGPRAHLLGTCGKEGLEIKQGVGGLDDTVHTALFKPDFLEEHLALLIVVELGYLALGLCCDHQDLGVLVLDGFTHGVNIGVAVHGALVIHVADIEHRFVGEQEQLMGYLFLVLVDQFNGACAMALLQGFLVTLQDLILHLGLTVATGLGLLLDAVDAALDGLQVAQLQLQVNDFLVTNRINGTIDMGHVLVIKATQHMDDGVGLTDVSQEFVSQSLTTARTLDQTRNVHDLDGRGHDTCRVHQLGQLIQALIGHGDHAHIGLDGAERKVCRLRLGIRQAVKQGRFAHVGQPHYSTL